MIPNGQTVTTGTFVRALKKLNPALRVCAFENSNRLAGLYLIDKQGRWEDICGVDKSYVPAYATFDAGGHVVKSGWRRAFWILLGNGYTTRQRVAAVCPGFFDSRASARDRFVGGVIGDPVENKLIQYAMNAKAIVETEDGEFVEVLSDEQIVDVAETIRAKETDRQKEDRAHDVWFLEKWKKQGGGITDRPNY